MNVMARSSFTVWYCFDGLSLLLLLLWKDVLAYVIELNGVLLLVLPGEMASAKF